MSGYWAANWPIWISAFCVLAVYTYLYKDNALYRVMMQIFIGVNLGYQAVIQWRDVLYPQWWLPMLDGFDALFGGKGSPWGVLWLLVGVLGAMFYLQLSRKYAPFSKIAIGITIGIGAGLTFKSQFGQNLPQLLDSFKPLAPSVVRMQPKTALRLAGSDFAPLVDGSLAVFVTGRQAVAQEVMGGVELWRTTLPSPASGSPVVSGQFIDVPAGTNVLELDPSSGAIVANRRSTATEPPAVALEAQAVYRQPQYIHGVDLIAKGNLIRGVALRNGVAEGVRKNDELWNRAFAEPVVCLQSFDGVAMVVGRHRSELWELPVPQAKLTFGDYFDNWVFVLTLVGVMSYFFFSFKRRGPIPVAAATFGRWMLMIGFGAFFGNTVMTRMSFLLDRLMFLIDDWLRPLWHALFR
ncbi:MAG: hypothetical protein P4L46_03115 [Fimbriimonas sp.]|nr:hypothetical protein [Fimbriimonas sp.]